MAEMAEMTELEEIESMLRGEFVGVAESLRVPPQPATPDGAPSDPRRWIVPVAIAAAIVLVLGGITLALQHRPGRTPPPTSIPKSLPLIPFTVGRTLYVDGRAMPGAWSTVLTAGDAWVAAQKDGWWWGKGRDAHRITGGSHAMPRLSSDGRVIAIERRTGGSRHIEVRATDSNRLLGRWRVPGKGREANAAFLAAVTSPHVMVFVEGVRNTQVWDVASGTAHAMKDGYALLPADDGQMVFGDIHGRQWLGSIDDSGRVHLTKQLPKQFDALSTDGWYLRGIGMMPLRSGRNHDRVPTGFVVAPVGSTRLTRLDLPAGWGAQGVAWEAPGRIVADGVPTGHGTVTMAQHRLIRCVVSLKRCAVVGD